jgi:vacuolar protein sorting-associated protein 26
VKHTL